MAPAVLAAAEATLPGDLGLRPCPVPRAGLRRAGRGPGQGGKGLCRGPARAAARAVACGAHRDRGYADGADWLAQSTGPSRAEARSELGTAGSLAALPATARRPGPRRGVAQRSGRGGPGRSRAPGQRRRAGGPGQGPGPGGGQRRSAQEGPTGSAPRGPGRAPARRPLLPPLADELGMVRFSGALPPTVGIGIVNRIEAEAARLRRGARARAHRAAEPGEPRAPPAPTPWSRCWPARARAVAPRADLVVVVDLAAYRRGHGHPGETCHIVGGAGDRRLRPPSTPRTPS